MQSNIAEYYHLLGQEVNINGVSKLAREMATLIANEKEKPTLTNLINSPFKLRSKLKPRVAQERRAGFSKLTSTEKVDKIWNQMLEKLRSGVLEGS